MMAKKVEQRDFPGLMLEGDPHDTPPGAARRQENAQSADLGSLRVRRGYRVVSFAADAPDPCADEDASASVDTFLPSSLEDLFFWFRADSGALNASDNGASDNDPVKTWQDGGPNGYHIQQSSAGSRPTFRETMINGQPVVRYDGTDDALPFVSSPSQPTKFTMWAVVDLSRDDTVDYRQFLDRNGGGTPPACYLSTNSSAGPGIYWHGSVVADWGGSVNRVAIVRWRWDASSPIAGVRVDSGGEVTGVPGGSTLDTFKAFGYVGSQCPLADAAEMVAIDDTPTSEEDDQVMNYLSEKWGITV